MSAFQPLTDEQATALKALTVIQRKMRRLEVRLTLKESRVRVARALRPVRGLRKLSDLRWHAQISLAEGRALNALARGLAAKKVFMKILKATRARVDSIGVL
jgi:hypothetical protein